MIDLFEGTHFLLVPDGNAARRARRWLAEQGYGAGVTAGSWPELLGLVARSYRIPFDAERGWEGALMPALAGDRAAFWSQSFDCAPEETLGAVAEGLEQVLLSRHPAADWPGEGLPGGAPARVAEHYHRLAALLAELDGRLPGRYQLIRDLLSGEGAPLRAIRVHAVPGEPGAGDGYPALDRWQRALLERLDKDAQALPNPPALAKALRELADPEPAAREESMLGCLQRHLFDTERHGEGGAGDESLQVIAVRDSREEIELAAGFIQREMAADPGLGYHDFAIMIPPVGEYVDTLESVFTEAGIPCSGLAEGYARRDLGREALSLLLEIRRGNAPRMALAALYTSPLMPWSGAAGRSWARSVIEGGARHPALETLEPEAQALFRVLHTTDTTRERLSEIVIEFPALLAGGEALAEHRERAREAAERVASALSLDEEPLGPTPWDYLQRLIRPQSLTPRGSETYNREGVQVILEGREPHRPMRQLLVLGFQEDHYPVLPKRSVVFHPEEATELVGLGGPTLPLPEDELALQRRRLVRALRLASDRVRLLIPRLSRAGAAQAPSSTLAFIEALYAPGAQTVLDIDKDADRERIVALPLAPERPCERPRLPRPQQDALDLGHDLLDADNAGFAGAANESPSRLETLLVCPLAWLLGRYDALPREWCPEALDARVRGTLSHRVFERLFRPDEPRPEREEIPERVTMHLELAIRELAPFLSTPQWGVERRYLLAELRRAAIGWHDLLSELDAEVLSAETTLAGELEGVALRGKSDVTINGRAGRLMLDYKDSRQANWQLRMESGYDLQASLYRQMLNADSEQGHARALVGGEDLGVGYFTLMDARLTVDVPAPEEAGPAWRSVTRDIAENARVLIGDRIRALRAGRLTLSHPGDAELFEKLAGIRPHAFAASPLIALAPRPTPPTPPKQESPK